MQFFSSFLIDSFTPKVSVSYLNYVLLAQTEGEDAAADLFFFFRSESN